MPARRLLFACALLCSTLLIAGGVPASQMASAAPGVTVNAKALVLYGKFTPKVTRIHRGTKVTFNAVNATHTITAYNGGWSFNKRIDASSGTATPQRVSFVFHTAGTYYFRCRIHSTFGGSICAYMCGKIVVS